MNCGSCNEMIPDDSMFCPECGARQDTSIAGSFQPMQQRNFEPVTGMNARMQQENNMNQFQNVPPDQFQNMAQNIQQNPNLPPNMYQQNQMGFPQQMQQQPMNMGQQNQMGFPQQMQQQPMNQQMGNNPQMGNAQSRQPSDLPKATRGPSLGSGAIPTSNRGQFNPAQSGGTRIAQNPEVSQTDAMVNRLAEAERAVKDERRSQWLNMNQNAASDVLSSLGGDVPQHLQGKGSTDSTAAQILAGSQKEDAPNDALLRRMAEVASRRVARKRGVAVESPQVKLSDDILTVNLTYVDDGRVLDTPDDLSQAFEQAIQTEIALKGYDFSAEVQLFRNKDGKTEKIGEEESDEEMFSCEMCDGLVKESDPECPHCGALFEEEEEEEAPVNQKSGGRPPGPSRGSPPGPSRGGGPPGPSRGGGPPGPSRGGGPPGPSKGGPPKGGSGGGPPGPKKGGPPKGGPGGGPPGPSKGGPPKGGPGGGPPGPKKGGPPKGGPPGGGPPGPKKGGPPKGGPPGPKKGGPPGPKK